MVAAGRVSSESEAVDYALAALTDEESLNDHDKTWWGRLAELDAEADEDLRFGRVRPFDEGFFERLRARVSVQREGPA